MVTLVQKMLLISLLFILKFVYNVNGISCKDDVGRDTDWFILYKLPKMNDTEIPWLFRSGKGYVYIDSTTEHKSTFSHSSHHISSAASMLGLTIQQFYIQKNQKDATYLIYNDITPNSIKSNLGRSKGILLFDGNKGIWLTHSIPRFPALEAYRYPPEEEKNGHMAFCLTVQEDEIMEIGTQLLYMQPSVYASKLSKRAKSFLTEDVQSMFTSKPRWARDSISRKASFKSAENRWNFASFAKNDLIVQDLYSSLVAPGTQTDILVQSWRPHDSLNQNCRSPFHTGNVETINNEFMFGATLVTAKYVSYLDDHSKWAVSTNSNRPWFCVGDLDRVVSEKKRSGGAVCIESDKVQRAFMDIIETLNDCEMI